MIFTIYSKPGCPWCDRAKQYIFDHGHEFHEKKIVDLDEQKEIKDHYGLKTFPIITHDNEIIGGFTDLVSWFNRD